MARALFCAIWVWRLLMALIVWSGRLRGLGEQDELFGPVASLATAWRAIEAASFHT